MKRLLLAGTLVLTFALARAQEDAYVSLVGMAVSAKDDKGPEPGDVPVAPAPKPERKSDDRAAVKAPSLPPRVWTRLFSSLLPAPSFEVAASTVPPRKATPASAAGSAQGMLELVAAATAPAP